MRPLIDLHHIELFLTWATLLQVGRQDDLYHWIGTLSNRLFSRRSGNAQIPFIEGHNSLELVFEHVATGEKPHEFCNTSSVYLLCLVELICRLSPDRRDSLLKLVYQRLVCGKADCGTQMEGCDPIDLMLWIPRSDWGDRVLTKTLADEGECVTVHLGKPGEDEPTTAEQIAESLSMLVSETREKRDFEFPNDIPMSVIVLACSKHRSPLPPESWRRAAFPSLAEPQSGQECEPSSG